MTYNQKLNAITRSVIVLTFLGLLFQRSFRIFIVAIITLVAIFFMHYAHVAALRGEEEAFITNGGEPIILDEISDAYARDPAIFQQPSSANPLGNVLVPDIEYHPDRKSAPPVSNKAIQNEILTQAKRMVAKENPGQPDIVKKLFRDLDDEIDFEQSMRQFYTNASTTVPNDQAAFADFCYGSMVSCKDGSQLACSRNNPRYTDP
jgi:hypothetical protein